jgi:uncharacterized protein YbjT (DUF2867 family)
MSSQFKTVIIVGATGDLGSKVTQAFLAKNQFDVSILVRKVSDKSKELERKGARVVETDFSNLDSLTKALQGVDAVISTIGSMALQEQVLLIDAAVASGVKRFIPSEYGSDPEVIGRGRHPLFDVKVSLQDKLRASPIEYTFIYTNPWMSYLFSEYFQVDFAKKTAPDFGPDAVLSAISVDDLAKLIPEVLLDPSSKNSSVRMAGDVFKWSDVLALLEKLTNQKWNLTKVTDEIIARSCENTTDPVVTFRALVWQSILNNQSVLEPIHNLNNPLYSHIKLTTMQEYVAALV